MKSSFRVMRAWLSVAALWSLLTAVAFSVLLVPRARSQEATYEPGETIQVPAPVGFSSSKLGVGKPVGGSSFSTVEVVPSEGKVISVSEDAYRATLRRQQSQFQLEATADALGLASAQWKDASRYRYAHLQVRHITRVERLETNAPPPQNSGADYFISAVYYGWSLDVMVRGRSETFTRGVAARLEKLVQGGVSGSFQQVTRKNELTTEVKARGLRSAGGGPQVALSPEEVERQFEVGDPQPILVEYTFIDETESKPIEWGSRSIGPGRYRIEQVGLEISNQKGNGQDWDALSPSADPMVRMYRNGRFISVIGAKSEQTSATFDLGREIALNPNTELSFQVVDEDLSQHDPVGRFSARYERLSQGTPGEKISLDTQDQVQSAWITLSAIKQYGPDPSDAEGSAPARIASVYEGPNGIFEIGEPEGWRDQYRADWREDGRYHLQFMLSPPSAERAKLGGYLSEGVRLNLWMTPDGRRTGVDVQQWAPRSIRGLLSANDGFTFADSSIVSVGNTRGIAYTLVGNSPEISEPEKTRIIYIATPRYTCRIGLVSPARLWEAYQPRFREMVKSFRVTGGPPPR